MSACKFKVGDRVRVRQWDEMFETHREYNVDSPNYGEISFTAWMKHLCGEERVISKIENYNSVLHRFEFTRPMDVHRNWIIVDWMLEPADDAVEIPFLELERILEGQT